MIDEREDEIRRRAYSIWESEGRPDGHHERHWLQATKEVDAATEKGAGEAQKPIDPALMPIGDPAGAA